jgi:hypothetical protein
VRQRAKLTNEVQEQCEAIGQGADDDANNEWGSEDQMQSAGRKRRPRAHGRLFGWLLPKGEAPGGEAAGQNKCRGAPRSRSQGRRKWKVGALEVRGWLRVSQTLRLSAIGLSWSAPMTLLGTNGPLWACGSNTGLQSCL